MPHGHDFPALGPVGAPGRDRELGRERPGLHHERVIAHAGEGARDPGEQLVPFVHDGAGLAMHQPPGPAYPCAERLADRLVPEAHAQDRELPGQRFHEGHEDPGIGRRTGARREDCGAGLQGQHVRDAERVVAVNDGLRAQLTQILDQVVCERVVVVEHEQHGENLTGSKGAKIARMEALERLVAQVDSWSQWLVGSADGRSTYALTRWVFLRALGVIYLIAFVSLWVQVKGLLGTQGILPAQQYLQVLRGYVGPERYRLAPTLFWLA